MNSCSIFENGTKILKKISDVFQPFELTKLAYETHFIQRSTSLLQAKDFVHLMSVVSTDPKIVPLEGLCSALRTLNPDADITPQSLMERINDSSAAQFLQRVFQLVLEKGLVNFVQRVPPDLLKPFMNVWIQDCSECVLNESLQKAFKGSGGETSKASVKINLIYEMNRKVIHSVDLVDRRFPDQKLARNYLKIIQEGDLVIRDLGFFDAEVLKSIDDTNAFFLSRLPACVHVYLNQDDTEPLDLGTYISKNFPNQAVVDIPVFVSTEKLPCRLIAYKAPQELADARRREAHKRAGKRGYAPKQERLRRLDFTLFITNVPVEVWKAEVVGTIYTIRWQIELIFKNWKSSLHINYLKGSNEHRIRCLLYGRLISIVVVNMIYQLADLYADKIGKELSLHKIVNWLKQENRLKKVIVEGVGKAFLLELEREIPKTLCKDAKRSRKTTAARLKTNESFVDLYLQTTNGQEVKVA